MPTQDAQLYDTLRGWQPLPDGIDPALYRRVYVGAGAPAGVAAYASPADLEPNTVHEIHAFNVVERVPDLVDFWKSCHRALVVGGTLHVVGAHWTHADSHSDPTRIRGLSERMFMYLSAKWRQALATDLLEDDVGAKALDGVDFEIVNITQIGEPEWDGRSDEARAWALAHFTNVIRRLDVVLRKL